MSLISTLKEIPKFFSTLSGVDFLTKIPLEQLFDDPLKQFQTL
jgi:hypothetical protein